MQLLVVPVGQVNVLKKEEVSIRVHWRKNLYTSSGYIIFTVCPISSKKILVSLFVQSILNKHVSNKIGTFTCMLLSRHVRVSEWIFTLWLPECQELLAQNRHDIWSLSDSNEIWTYNHLVHKQTLYHLTKLVKTKFVYCKWYWFKWCSSRSSDANIIFEKLQFSSITCSCFKEHFSKTNGCMLFF